MEKLNLHGKTGFIIGGTRGIGTYKYHNTCAEAMLLLDEICFNRLCHPVMRSLSYYTNFFDFSILRKLL